MAGKKTTKKPTRKPAAEPVRALAFAGSLGDFVDVIANEIKRRNNADVQTAPPSNVGVMQSTPRPDVPPTTNSAAPPTAFEIVKANRNRAESLLGRLNNLESALRDNPQGGGETASSPLPPGMNGSLALTGTYIDEAHDALSRISKYLGIEV